MRVAIRGNPFPGSTRLLQLFVCIMEVSGDTGKVCLSLKEWVAQTSLERFMGAINQQEVPARKLLDIIINSRACISD